MARAMGKGFSSKGGIVLVAAMFAVAIVAFALVQLLGASAAAGSHPYAVVHDGDGGVQAFDMGEEGSHAVTTSLGTNVVVCGGGAVKVQSADCENQDCVHQGSIESAAKQIICLPHKLWIEVVFADDAEAACASASSSTASQQARSGEYDTVGR